MSNDDTPEKMELTSMDLAAQKRQELRQLLPEVFAEDRVDFALFAPRIDHPAIVPPMALARQ